MSDTMFYALMGLAAVCLGFAARFVWLGLCSHFHRRASEKADQHAEQSIAAMSEAELVDIIRQFGA
ncbi:hypothetical protein ACLE20_13305 [Rhizobium sp. YIM 134829]|uniref:hypothetical protein n=1 Tax=Rhizobium sp. YIM 134829 TaxID=3390453 RepID=UPI00397B2AB3